MKDLRTIYEGLTSTRSRYLNAADEVARLTLPWLDVFGNEDVRDRPYTHSGTQAVRSLSSSLLKLMMPPGVNWGTVSISPENWLLIEEAWAAEGVDPIAAREQVESLLRKRTQEIHDSLSHKSARSRLSSALRRNMVEGNTLVVNTRKRLSVFPLRSFCVVREDGEIRLLVLKECIVPNPAAIGSEKANEVEVYTLVEYPSVNPRARKTDRMPVGKVWRQVGDQKPRVVGEDPSQYFVIVPEVPDVEDYAYGYAHNFLRLIAHIDHAEHSLGEAMSVASYHRPIIREGSSTSRDWGRFIAGQSGEPWVGNPEDLSWFSSPMKLGEWGMLAQFIQRADADLARSFAMGIKDRPMRGSTSATEVLTITDEVSTQTADLHTSFEESFQIPLLISELMLWERAFPMLPDVGADIRDIVRVQVTTGSNVIAKQNALLKFVMQFLPALQQMDPQRFRPNGGPIADVYTSALPFTTEGLYEWDANPPQPEPMPGQAVEGEEPAREDIIMTNGGPQPPQSGLQPGSPT